jgi:hypothetical protein
MHAFVTSRRFATAAAVGAAALALGLSVASGEDGATVLKGQFRSNEIFLVDGVPTLFAFICEEQRVQRPDGSARDTAHCQLDPEETPPSRAAHEAPVGVGYQSDFFIAGVPGYEGPSITFDWHGVVTPSGRVTMVANFPPG